MPGVDKDCKGPGATHHHACKCREEHFRKLEAKLKDAEAALREAMEALKYCVKTVDIKNSDFGQRTPLQFETYGDLSGIVYNVRTKHLIGAHQRSKVLPAESNIHIDNRFDPPSPCRTVSQGHVDIKGERFHYREVDADEQWETEARRISESIRRRTTIKKEQ